MEEIKNIKLSNQTMKEWEDKFIHEQISVFDFFENNRIICNFSVFPAIIYKVISSRKGVKLCQK